VASRSRSTNDDVALDRLADLPAERHAVRLKALTPVAPVDAAEITRLHGKTRTWVYDHAGELGAGRLGSNPRQRLAFSPDAHTMRRSEEERQRLTALVQGHVWAANGQRKPVTHRPAHRATDS
jgi:hypothetical protein